MGTTKGAFLLRSADRKRWELTGPMLAGMEVNHMVYDRRDGSVYAAANSYQYGATVHRSTDMGQTWTLTSDGLRYAADDAEKVRRVWHVEPGPESQPGVVYAGVEDSGLFRSDDYGSTWRELGALRQHPTHAKWAPGNGGKCLHTIALDPADPKRIYIAASAGGIYRSDDGGESWKPLNKGIRAGFLPEGQQYPDAGQ